MRRGQGKYRGQIPALWLMTDERIADRDLLRAVRRLPRGSVTVFRHYRLSPAERRALFDAVRREARQRGVLILLAGDPVRAREWRADGHHGRAPFAGAPPGWLHSAPAHDMAELRAAERAGADAILLSPLFATRSHPGACPLGAARFAALARRTVLPVIALGGLLPRHEALVRRLGARGIAAIDGLTQAAD